MFSIDSSQSRQGMSARAWRAARQFEFKDRPSCR
jgi:hypothetical protein